MVLARSVLTALVVMATTAHAQPEGSAAGSAAAGVTIDLPELQLPAVTLPVSEDELATMWNIAKGSFNRARRAIALGPEVGISIGRLAAATAELETPISFGLGLVVFKVPVLPSMDLVRDVIRARVKARLIEQLKIAMAGGQVSPPRQQDIERLAVEIYESLRAEILGQMAARARRFERPRFGIHLEGGFWPRASEGEGRLTGLYGLGRISIGPTLALHVRSDAPDFEGGLGGSFGVEVDFHIMMSTGPRSHPAIVYMRGESGVTSKVDYQLVSLGVRLMLDAI